MQASDSAFTACCWPAPHQPNSRANAATKAARWHQAPPQALVRAAAVLRSMKYSHERPPPAALLQLCCSTAAVAVQLHPSSGTGGCQGTQRTRQGVRQ